MIVQGWLVPEELPLIFDVMLHVGTLCAVVLMFWRDIVEILKALIRLDFKTEKGKLALYIAVGSVPTAFIGLLFHDIFESFFYNLFAVGIALLITGSFLYVSERRKNGEELGLLNSLLIGVAQGISIIPGISRSGATITTGLLRKMEKEKAFRYSFLLSIPAIMGATVTESMRVSMENIDVAVMFLGVVISMIVGFVSLKLLLKVVLKEKFHLFAYYCWTVGAIITFSQFLQSV